MIAGASDGQITLPFLSDLPAAGRTGAELRAQIDSRVGATCSVVELLQGATVASLINVAQNSLVTGTEARRWGNQHPNLVPYQLFHALDRPIIIAVGTDAQWVACATALGLEDLAADSPLSTNAGRLAGRDRIVDALSRRVAERSAHEWIAVLQKNGVPCGLVKSVLEALSEVDASPLTGIAPSVPGVVRLPPPKLDEHGDAIRRHGWRVFEGPDR